MGYFMYSPIKMVDPLVGVKIFFGEGAGDHAAAD